MTENNFDKAVNNFIVDEEEYSKEKITPLIEILSKFCKITKKGDVFPLKDIPTRKILKLILSARLVAHFVDKNISAEMSREELKAYSMMKNEVFTTRFNEMLRENFAEEKNKNFSAKNILLVEQFLKKFGDEKDV